MQDHAMGEGSMSKNREHSQALSKRQERDVEPGSSARNGGRHRKQLRVSRPTSGAAITSGGIQSASSPPPRSTTPGLPYNSSRGARDLPGDGIARTILGPVLGANYNGEQIPFTGNGSQAKPPGPHPLPRQQ